MTERTLQLAIMATYRSQCLCACPNYTPVGWWECDLWMVTRAGYATEFEIKTSLADFRVDAKKSREKWVQAMQTTTTERKHDLIGLDAGPSRFFYAVPKAIKDAVEAELPEWAGLVTPRHDDSPRHGVRIIRDAPRLHTTKINKREIRLAERRMWYRYWEALRDIQRLKQELEVVK